MAIINRKNISTSGFDQDALTTSTSGDQIINFGNLSTTGDLANGIFAGADNVTIHNFGHIETSGLGAAGIYAEGSDAHIDNFGTVVTHSGFFDPDPNVDGDEFFSEGIFADGDRFHIANYGSVSVEGESSSALIGIGADGVIVNYGRVESVADGLVLAALGDRSQIINAGEVTARGDEVDT